MNKSEINNNLLSIPSRNETLQYLYEVEKLADHIDDEIIDRLTKMIPNADTIENTNGFASLLADINSEDFIQPLISSISKATPGQTTYLADYMFALIEILDELDYYYIAHDDFVHLLGDWLLNTAGGEISWKAGDILHSLESPATREYLLKGALDSSLFFITRITCLRAVVNQYRSEAAAIIAELVNDSDSKVKEQALDAQAYLAER